MPTPPGPRSAEAILVAEDPERERPREVDRVLEFGERSGEIFGDLAGDISEYCIDFRRAGGKNPRFRRGMRTISIGEAKCSTLTQESCVPRVSRSREWVVAKDGDVAALERGAGWADAALEDEGHCGLARVGVDMESSLPSSSRRSKVEEDGDGTFRPLMLHASTGR